MATLASDTFVRSNVSGSWGTGTSGAVWSRQTGTDTLNVTSNHGQITYNSSSSSDRLLYGSGTATDQEGLVRITIGSTSNQSGVILRSNSNCSTLYLGRLFSSTQVQIGVYSSGSFTSLGIFTSGITTSTGQAYWVRFRVKGSALSIKMWADGTTEGGSWTGTATDTTIASGQYGLYSNVTTSSTTEQFDQFLINDTVGLASGGFALFANGTGTATFDHLRVTQYPDPALSLAPIVPRTGTTLIAWNANVPTNTTLGMDISLDGVNWTDVTSQNGGSLPSIYSQPDPTIDGFTSNTSANYTSTFRTGGAAGTWTPDTANSRLVATGGTNAIYVSTLISRAEVDFFADLDRADAGGIVWRYVDQNNFYYLLIADTLASTGTKNTVTLYKVASNVQTQLATAAISYTVGPTTVVFTRGTYHRFRVSMLSGVITVYVDGVQLATYTDGSPLGAGLMGFFNNGGTTGSRYYQLWIQPQGDNVTGNPAGDTTTGQFVYTRQRLSTSDPSVTPQVLDITTMAAAPTIGAGVSIPSVTYNASLISKNFDDLAKQSNYSWYIDQNKILNFRSRMANAAPWILQSTPYGLVQTNDLEVDSNLELDVENDLYRNRQIILGANDTATFVETKIGDGNARSWTLGYQVAAQPAITLNGVTVPSTSIGLKGNIGFRYYYALGDPVITQDAGQTVLQATDQLTVTYIGQFGITVTIDDLTEQTSRASIEGGTGIVEDVQDVTDQGLNKAAAITLANQLLNRYAIAGRTLIFDTTRNGLQVGQILTIFLVEHGIWDGQFFITQVEVSLMKGVADTQIWIYKVTASELPKQASWAKLLATGIGLQ